MNLADISLRCVDSLDEANAMMRWLGERRDVLAIDSETEGLQHWRDRVRLVQLGDVNTGWAIPWEWSGLIWEAILGYEGRMVFHHAAFDTRMLEHWGGRRLPWELIDDTYIMARLINPVGPAGLKQLAAIHVDQRAAYASKVLDQAMAEQNWTWKTVPLNFEPYWAYGALDCVLTARLYDVLEPQMRPMRSLYETEMACLRILIDMELKGCRVDLEHTRDLLYRGRAYCQQVEDWCVATYGFKPGANQKVAEQLLRDGVDLTEVTATGRWQLNVDVLEACGNHPLAQQVLARRKAEKLCGSYLENFLALADGDVLHPNINSLAAKTGRMSITEPGLQTLPRGPVIRNCFIPRDGNVIISTDYSQIEARVAAHFSQDQGLIAAFAGDDLFSTIAREMYAEPAMPKSDPRRQMTKNMVYALLYGAGVEKMAKTAGVSFDTMQIAYDRFSSRYPGIGQLQQRIIDTARQRERDEGQAYIVTPAGRQLVAEDRQYALTNYLIQGHCCEILKQAIIDLDAVGVGEYMILPVHDEILVDVPVEDAGEVGHVVKETMTRVDYAVPLTAESSGPLARWGDKQ